MNTQQIETLVAQGGPEPEQYEALTGFINRLYEQRLLPNGSVAINRFYKLLGDAISTTETLQGLSACKPHGYPGDFEIIDKIYAEHKTPLFRLRKWDDFFHAQSAPKAVRNRKLYFSKLLDRMTAVLPEMSVLNISSGPGRCMKTWMENNPDNHVNIDCIEHDPNAIAFSKSINKPYLDKISFKEKSLLKYRPQTQYHLIWASGIFDYFSDNLFKGIVERLLPAVRPGGSLVIGNFATGNPSRAYMELLGKWTLNHRSPNQLIELCSGLVNDVSRIRIEKESEGVNLFLHIDK